MIEKSLTGNQAVSYGMKQINPEVVAAFPITPSTGIVESFSMYVNNNDVDTEFIAVESEHSAMSACIGASLSGARAMTASSSNGIAYMWEMLHIASSMRAPVIMSVASRAISGPLNIHNDHSDISAFNGTGWIVLFAENNQEAYDNLLIGTRLAEDPNVMLPIAIGQDGFITSHATENMFLLEDKEVKNFVGEFERKDSLLDKENPITTGPLDLPGYLFEHKKGQADGIAHVEKVLEKLDQEYYEITKRKYSFYEKYKTEDAEDIIIVMGSTAGTIKEVVDELRENGRKVGLIKIRLFRPFPGLKLAKDLAELKNLKNIAVLDKVEMLNGSGGIIYEDVLSSIYRYKNHEDVVNALKEKEHKNILDVNILGYVYGIGGRDVKETDIKNVYEELQKNEINDGSIRYLGLRG